MQPSPSFSEAPVPDIGINDAGLFPRPETTPTEPPDIIINDDGLLPESYVTPSTLPDTGTPIAPVLITGLGMVGAGVNIVAASRQRQ